MTHYKKTDNYTAVSMRCTEEQFKELEPILRGNGIRIYRVDNFKLNVYITNNWAKDGTVVIANHVDKHSIILENTVHETYDKDLFLSCCGLERIYTFEEAVELVKNGTHAIDKDCDDLELLIEILDNAFPKDYSLECRKKNCITENKYFSLFLLKTSNWTGENSTNIPTIKLSQIQPKEMKYTITKDQIKDLHQSESIEVVREKLETLFSEVLPNEKTQAIDEIREKMQRLGIYKSEI